MKKFYSLSMGLALPIVLATFTNSISQERCGTVEYSKSLYKDNLQNKENNFESWIKGRIENRNARINTASSSFQVPVVVHIIHRGEPIGVGSNVSDAQVQSQISVLNKDFNRLNSDTVDTPSEFLPFAGSVNIEFVLARQTPDGLPTSGIVRVRGSQNTWSMENNALLKATSYWPAEDYLNMWVTDLADGLLGYAQFPVSTLPGMEGADNNRLTDGVVVDYMAFGSIDDGPFDLNARFDKGRAATHELGHFFGLRHIWGDDNGFCGGPGDYVSDTPDQGDKTSNCPTNPLTSCGHHVMFQNYMDYTNDDCMNLYTQGQISRIETVISESPRRASLNDSHGLIDPVPLANDMGIHEIVSPGVNECAHTIQPIVIVKNNGLNPVSSTVLKLTLNGEEVEARTFSFNPALQPSGSAEIVFDALTVVSGDNVFLFDIIQTNGTDDAKEHDNHEDVIAFTPHSASLPMQENFDALPSSWQVQNPDDEITWSIRQATTTATTNRAVYLNFHQYNDEGEVDRLLTPVFDLSNATSPYLIFDVAYARYQNKSDGLKIYVISDCSTEEIEVYSKSGATLATTSSVNNSFIPSGAGHWRKELVNLGDFIGQGKIQLAFAGINDHGNNLYVDNVKIIENLSENLSLRQVSRPSPVQCREESAPVLLIENSGSAIVNSFKVNYSVNGGITQTIPVNNINLLPGTQTEISLPSVGLLDGTNTLLFEVDEPNGLTDIYPEDNHLTIETVLHSFQDHIPLRETFNSNWENAWRTVNPIGGMNWQEVTTNFDRSLYFESYSNSVIGDQAWLVSPVLDFSMTTAASVFFDLSYRHRDSKDDELMILASRNCGESYDEVLFTRSGASITDIGSSNAWAPSQLSDWERIFVNLNSLAGEENVRLAFVFTNANGNNIYLDNIEFFTSDDPDPAIPEDLYTLYGNGLEGSDDFHIKFNLATRQSVRLEIVNVTGQPIASCELQDVLNQNFRIDAGDRSAGMYIVRMVINNKFYAEKVYLNR